MNPNRPRIEGVPTNIVTGFLGAGKTTAILHLLRQKPAEERWAVLVNEFGEVGIDGALLSGQQATGEEVFFREVPGGCMCCTAGLPMQVALNALLQQSRPHRLLIEPTGLGHPREVLSTLGEEHYREVIDLRATITLVDPRKLQDPRVRSHEIFGQQLEVADLIVANKVDLCGPEDFEALDSFLVERGLQQQSPFRRVAHGELDPAWLAPKAERYILPPGPAHDHDHGHDHGHDHDHHHGETTPLPREAPPGGHVRVDNEGEGFVSAGWIFDPTLIFDSNSFRDLLLGVQAERAKGVVITEAGILGFQISDGVLKEFELDESLDSRLEFLATDRTAFDGLEEALHACVRP